jgi:hypothetical protein
LSYQTINIIHFYDEFHDVPPPYLTRSLKAFTVALVNGWDNFVVAKGINFPPALASD